MAYDNPTYRKAYTMSKQTAITIQQDPQAVIRLVLDGLTSENSRRAYSKALTDFLAWFE